MTIIEDLSEEEVEQLWIKEAVRRDAELDSGSAAMRDADEVFRDAISLLIRMSANGAEYESQGQVPTFVGTSPW